MDSIDFDFDHAMCTYLGGARDSSAIQTGRCEKQLHAEYGPETPRIKALLDKVLDTASNSVGENEQIIDQFGNFNQTLYQRLTIPIPNVAITTRKKIAAYVIYRIVH